ncbi:MAG: hypothetical protein N3D82_03530 [Ignisphaera sp.]|nr:hypothetical protein [Ignisphaera sp.]MCX8168078.1 hypothetical protein [Ignisphaera sp.]MDW8085902.1 hypothetical protein [Ignisphaera sp.]
MHKPERGGSSTTLPSRREEKYPRHREKRDAYRGRERIEETAPKPIGSMCSPSCPLFKCSKRVLIVNLINGKPTPYCSWVNDNCIGYKCQYAMCTVRYLLPDGKCLSAIRTEPKSEDEFIKELESRESSTSLKSLLSRRGIRKDLGVEDF